jgi:hypothetical protein
MIESTVVPSRRATSSAWRMRKSGGDWEEGEPPRRKGNAERRMLVVGLKQSKVVDFQSSGQLTGNPCHGASESRYESVSQDPE